MAINQNLPYYQTNLDISHPNRKFHIYVSAGDTPSIRCYLFEGGKQYTPPTDWTCKIGYTAEDYEYSTTMVTVDGQVSDGTGDDPNPNYCQFDLDGTETATSGDYFCQVQLSNADQTLNYIFGYGILHILRSPLGGEYTPETLTSSVNWDTVNLTGTPPYPDEYLKISEYTAANVAADTDLLDISQDQGDGVYISKKITFADLKTSLGL